MSIQHEQIMQLRCPNTDWGDRLIPKRSFLDLDLIHHKFSFSEEELSKTRDILCQEVSSQCLTSYQQNLRNVFLPNAQKYTRILPLYVHKECTDKPSHRIKHWPVHSRKKPCISTAKTMLDLPYINNHLRVNLLDWGSTNIIAAGISERLYLWHAGDNTRSTLTVKSGRSSTINCIKWHPDGNKLAYSYLDIGRLEIIDIHSKKVLRSNLVNCHAGCFISVIDFHPLQHSVAVGCTMGNITRFSSDLKSKFVCYLHRGNILALSYSNNGTYLASSGSDRNICVTRSDEVIFCVKMNSACRGVAWHPWKQSYLVLGDTSGVMMLYNVATNENLATYYPEIEHPNAVLCLSFSKNSGELVVSHSIKNNRQPMYVQVYLYDVNTATDQRMATEANKNCDRQLMQEIAEINYTQLNVLESFDRVVDRIFEHGSIFYLLWNPDGTKIASAGTDEVIHIWDFLPQSEQKNRKPRKKVKEKLESLQSESKMDFNMFGCSIR